MSSCDWDKRGRLPAGLLSGMAEVLRVLAHADRLRILEVLDLAGPLPVHEITVALDRPQTTVSQHLNRMRRSGLISCERRGKEVWYSISDPNSITILNCIRKKGART